MILTIGTAEKTYSKKKLTDKMYQESLDTNKSDLKKGLQKKN